MYGVIDALSLSHFRYVYHCERYILGVITHIISRISDVVLIAAEFLRRNFCQKRYEAATGRKCTAYVGAKQFRSESRQKKLAQIS